MAKKRKDGKLKTFLTWFILIVDVLTGMFFLFSFAFMGLWNTPITLTAILILTVIESLVIDQVAKE